MSSPADPNIRRIVGGDAPAEEPLHPSRRAHDSAASQLLLKIYLRKRIENQRAFYLSRTREFEANRGFMVSMGAAIMAVSTFVSAIGASANSAALALVTAILPAVAALLASFRQLYQWEKQSSLYRDAALGLEEAYLLMPDSDVYDPRTASVIYPRLVQAAEGVFEAEINQWGQIALGIDQDAERAEIQQAIEQMDDAERLARRNRDDFTTRGAG